jgi:aspartate carbamoyltransferase catalytic subunit
MGVIIMVHLLSVSQYQSIEVLDNFFDVVDGFVNRSKVHEIAGRVRVLGIIKDEGSTRTRVSFEVAMKRLGGEVVCLDLDGGSSIGKGESLEDTVRVMGEYVDLIVLRHSQTGAVEYASRKSLVPVINGGDGDGEHPTQALLDLYTIRRHFGKQSKLKVAIVGDLLHGRTIHSLIKLLCLYEGVQLHMVAPLGLELPQECCDYLRKFGVQYHNSYSLYETMARNEIDVVYMTRMQVERNSKSATYPVLGEKEMELLSPKSIVMHPLPRCGELPVTLDRFSQCVFWEQARNGMYVRMALLYNFFTKGEFIPFVR